MDFGAANITKHLEMVKSVSYSKFNSLCISFSTQCYICAGQTNICIVDSKNASMFLKFTKEVDTPRVNQDRRCVRLSTGHRL